MFTRETIMLSCIAREKLMFCKDLLISRKVQTSHIQRQFIIVNYIDLNKHFCLASNHMLQQNMSILYCIHDELNGVPNSRLEE